MVNMMMMMIHKQITACVVSKKGRSLHNTTGAIYCDLRIDMVLLLSYHRWLIGRGDMVTKASCIDDAEFLEC